MYVERTNTVFMVKNEGVGQAAPQWDGRGR